MPDKYKKPAVVENWEAHPFMPRNCWMCGFFNREFATCGKYNNSVVPEDFAAKEDDCPDWVDNQGIPF